jgi:hypothetical protein
MKARNHSRLKRVEVFNHDCVLPGAPDFGKVCNAAWTRLLYFIRENKLDLDKGDSLVFAFNGVQVTLAKPVPIVNTAARTAARRRRGGKAAADKQRKDGRDVLNRF